MAKHLYWWQKNDDEFTNFGDIIGPYIVKKLCKEEVVRVKHPSMRRYKYVIIHYLTVGSIISEANTNSVVWGSGIIYKNQEVRDACFLAVRGPHTRRRILEMGYECPEVYGDPALLLPDFYHPKKEKKYSLGIIPHYIDYAVVSEKFKEEKNILIIDVTNISVQEVVDQILSCSFIISSSLHGLIVPHAYNIPAIWTKFGEKLAGDDIKFYDYFESIGLDYVQPLKINVERLTVNDLFKLKSTKGTIPPIKQIYARRADLYKSSPFNKSLLWIFLFYLRLGFKKLNRIK